MSDFVQKEKYEGVWNGNAVRFTREWGGHRFTDAECEQLCKGEEIEIKGLKSKNGNTYGVKGRLANQMYNGHAYVGFERTGFVDSASIPDVFCEHEFTDQEKLDLEAGTEIFVENMVSKKGNTFSAKVRWGKKDDGAMGLILSFD